MSPDDSNAQPRRKNARPRSELMREAAMVRRYADSKDPALQAELVERFLPLARSLAMRYRGGTESLDDRVQVASLGRVKALDGFDPDRRRSVTAYAVPTMLGELRRHFRDRVWNVHLPRGLQERAMDVNDAIQKLGDRLNASPTVGQIAEHLDLSEEEVLEALEADEARRTLSLDAPRSREDAEAVPTIETVPSTEPGYEAIESQLAAADADLDEREKLVLKLRFGADMTQYEIGRKLGVSQMQISRIMRKALRKLLGAVQSGTEAEQALKEAAQG